MGSFISNCSTGLPEEEADFFFFFFSGDNTSTKRLASLISNSSTAAICVVSHGGQADDGVFPNFFAQLGLFYVCVCVCAQVHPTVDSKR